MDVHPQGQFDNTRPIVLLNPRFFIPIATTCDSSSIMGESVSELTLFLESAETEAAIAYFDNEHNLRLLFLRWHHEGSIERGKWRLESTRHHQSFEREETCTLQLYPKIGAVLLRYDDFVGVSYADKIAKKSANGKFSNAIEVELKDVLLLAIHWASTGDERRNILARMRSGKK